MNGRYNFLASLSHIAACTPDVVRMREQSEGESKLLSLYNVSLPLLAMPLSTGVTADGPSVALLQQHSSWILNNFVPAAVDADGNCFIESVPDLTAIDLGHVLAVFSLKLCGRGLVTVASLTSLSRGSSATAELLVLVPVY